MLTGLQRFRMQEGNVLVQDGAVTGHAYIMRCHKWEPEQVVRAARADAAPRGRMPPVQHVTLLELMGCRLEDVLAHQVRANVNVGHHVLKLVTKPVGAAGLIKRGPAPEAAGERLIQKPAIQKNVHARVRGLYPGLFQDLIPECFDTLPRGLHILDVFEVTNQSPCIFTVCTLPDQKSDLFGFARLQPEQGLQYSTWIVSGFQARGESDTFQGSRTGVTPEISQKLRAIRRHARGLACACQKGHALSEIGVVSISRQQGKRRGIKFRRDVSRRVFPRAAEHPFRVIGYVDAPHLFGRILKLKLDNFHGFVRHDKNRHILKQSMAGMLESRIARSMTDEIWRIGPRRQRRRRPDLPGILITQVNRLRRGITDGVITPGREAILAAVL